MHVLELFPDLESYNTSPLSRERYLSDERGKGFDWSGTCSSPWDKKMSLFAVHLASAIFTLASAISCSAARMDKKMPVICSPDWSLRLHLLSPPWRCAGAERKRQHTISFLSLCSNVAYVKCAYMCIQRKVQVSFLYIITSGWLISLCIAFISFIYIYFLKDTPVAKTRPSSPSTPLRSMCVAAKYYLTFDPLITLMKIFNFWILICYIMECNFGKRWYSLLPAIWSLFDVHCLTPLKLNLQ